MDIQAYIQSGILEQYSLGLLTEPESRDVVQMCQQYPEIKTELTAIEAAMEKMAADNSVKPSPLLKHQILGALGFAEVLDINNLPPTTQYSDYKSWLAAVEHLIPEQPFEDFFAHVLQQDEHLVQMLVVTKLDVPPETHTDIAESFFILEGHCSCTIGNQQVTLNPGDYLDIPLHVEHNVKITSPYVVAILQHKL